jgi:cobalt-zinc-cadmium efflux system membrane fusion protein
MTDGLIRRPETTREWLAVTGVAVVLLAAGAGLAAMFLDARGDDDTARAEMVPGMAHVPPATGAAPTGPVTVTLTREAIARAGIVVQTVTTRAIGRELRVPGTVEPNTERTTEVTSLVAGRVQSVSARLGDRVGAGQSLATIFSPDLANAQTRYLSQGAMLQAEQQKLDRTARLAEIGAASRQELEEIRAARQALATEVESARENLRLLGLSPARINALVNANQVSSTVAVPAPVAGEITERIANPGLVVDTTTKLFTVSDLSTVWISAAVGERDLAAVRIGATAVVNIPAYADEALQGRVTYVAPSIDPATRTATVRVETRNPAGRLKLGMFVNLRLGDIVSGTSAVVPRTSLQTIGDRAVVYVVSPNQPETFIEREVVVGDRAGDDIQIRSGLRPGEQVVVEGSFALRAERERTAPMAPAVAAASASTTAPVDNRFEQYEAIRVALAADRTEGIADHANALAGDLTSAGDRQSADLARAVAQAPDIKIARDRFGELSDRLVPQFLGHKITGVYGFVCPMVNRPWVQRGEKKGNPYYGTAMADCGNPLTSK